MTSSHSRLFFDVQYSWRTRAYRANKYTNQIRLVGHKLFNGRQEFVANT